MLQIIFLWDEHKDHIHAFMDYDLVEEKKITTNYTYSIEKLIKIQWQCMLNASCQVLVVPLEQWLNQDSVHTVLRNA